MTDLATRSHIGRSLQVQTRALLQPDCRLPHFATLLYKAPPPLHTLPASLKMPIQPARLSPPDVT